MTLVEEYFQRKSLGDATDKAEMSCGIIAGTQEEHAGQLGVMSREDFLELHL